jgi:hypothetical protein
MQKLQLTIARAGKLLNTVQSILASAARECIPLLVHCRQHVQEPGILPALPTGDVCPPQPLDPQPGEDSQPPSVELQLNIPGAEANYSNILRIALLIRPITV